MKIIFLKYKLKPLQTDIIFIFIKNKNYKKKYKKINIFQKNGLCLINCLNYWIYIVLYYDILWLI